MLCLRCFILKLTETEIFKIAFLLSYRYVFMWQSLKISSAFNTLTLKKIFRKTKTFFKKLENRFLVEKTKTENATLILNKATKQKSVLRQIEWGVQYRSIIKSGILPVSISYFWNFYFSERTSYKELIWCTNYANVHIHTFRKRLSFFEGDFS